MGRECVANDARDPEALGEELKAAAARAVELAARLRAGQITPCPGDLLAAGLPVSRDLPRLMIVAGVEAMNGFTPEQQEAIRRRKGELFLDAAAGSGKTSVLVERFARGVLEDGLDPAAILTITFTEKAAAEMRERIRERLRELGAPEAARATEGAFISTIHGFCARVLRAHALAVGIDPAFTVLDELEAGRLADAAFDAALTELAEDAPGALELIAGYGPLRAAGRDRGPARRAALPRRAPRRGSRRSRRDPSSSRLRDRVRRRGGPSPGRAAGGGRAVLPGGPGDRASRRVRRDRRGSVAGRPRGAAPAGW